MTLCVALAACSKQRSERAAPSSSPPAVSAATAAHTAPGVQSARVGQPEVKSEVEVAGLRVATGVVPGSSLWGFSDLEIDLDRARLQIVQPERGVPLPKLLPAGALAVVNGGYFELDFKPSAWLVSDGRVLAPKTSTARGGVLALSDTGFYLGPFSGLTFEPQLAVQSYPLIVEPNGRPGIRRDDGRRAARTVVCSVGERLHLIVISAARGDGPTLFEAMQLLRRPGPVGFGCTSALNLDGGPSSGVWFGPAVAAKQRVPLAPVAYGIAVLPGGGEAGKPQ